jgi:5-deoxy-glucuronate isomerase
MTGPRTPSLHGPYWPAGTAGAGEFTISLMPEDAGWRYASLQVIELMPGSATEIDTGEFELFVLPLVGSCTVRCDEITIELDGRAGVFDRVSDFAYVPRDARFVLSSFEGGRFAMPGARARRRLPPRYGAADAVPVEVRGAGSASRQVNNFGSPEGFETDRLIAVEILTPGGNWSSYPPHKHDEDRPGEAELEEIYYFEVAGGAPPGEVGPGGYQRVYSSGPNRGIDVLAEVSTGDVILVPYGYHGPSMAAPGYDLYYLNVLAGDGPVRTMSFCDDPAHAWIRDSWAEQPVDPRVPMTSHRGQPCG